MTGIAVVNMVFIFAPSAILESSKYTLDLGQSLLDQIKEMGMHADIQNRHATTAACYGIEHLLELLHDRRRHLEELWTQRKIQLEQCLQLCQLDQEVNKVREGKGNLTCVRYRWDCWGKSKQLVSQTQKSTSADWNEKIVVGWGTVSSVVLSREEVG